MTILQTIIMAITEGLTEFLPISSTGHMILISDLLKIQQTAFVKDFEIFIQLGAILAVVVLYLPKFIKPSKDWVKIIVGFIPTAVIGLILYKIVKTYLLGNTLIVAVALLLGGIALLVLEWWFKSRQPVINSIDEVNYQKSATLGLFQAISIIPGVSRSAATISGGMILGMTRKLAVEFSFLLAVPTMIAASGLDLVKSGWHFSGREYLLLGIGFVVAFLTAMIAVKAFVKYVESHSFVTFAIYRIVLGVVVLLLVR
ncbi:MAG: undecaprenyl-diphosphate phosphatase [candidate division WWE3 bacterium]|nr:undecaprenyl-diphosphate phosphatase [candidate division WWE3 bacterium]